MTKEHSAKKLIPTYSDSEMTAWIGMSSLAEKDGSDEVVLTNLRPGRFDHFVGQDRVKESVLIACQASKRRGEALDHILLHGPPGLGKTSMARLIAEELEVDFKATSGPVIERPGDLAAVLTTLNARDVLFIDEIHRLPRVVEEVLYPAMEDYAIDIMIGQGASAKSVRIDLKPFTLVGATTRAGMLTSPLRDRFGVSLRMDFYGADELKLILLRSAEILRVNIEDNAAYELAKRSRGTPRIANRLLKRVRDYAQEKAGGVVTLDVARTSLKFLEIDDRGLDNMDRCIIETIIDKFGGGPVGIETIAVAVSEERETIEDVYEPYLIQEGLLARTRRGREVTDRGYQHIGRRVPVGKQMALNIGEE